MPSKILRRSGVSVLGISEWLEWQPDLVVQVGVGIYHHETDVMSEAWPGVEFIGFEPNPRIVRSIKYPGTLHPYAIGDRMGDVTFYNKPGHKDGSSIFPHPDEAKREPITVPMWTLDGLEWIAFADKRILLWLDCEGSELLALKGGEQFVKTVGLINVELTGRPPCDGWCDPNETHDWLNAHGFFRVWIHTQRSRFGQYDSVYARADLFRPEQCCCPCQVAKCREWTG